MGLGFYHTHTVSVSVPMLFFVCFVFCLFSALHSDQHKAANVSAPKGKLNLLKLSSTKLTMTFGVQRKIKKQHSDLTEKIFENKKRGKVEYIYISLHMHTY